MTTQVKELLPMLESRNEESVTATLGQFHVNEDASSLSLPGHIWTLDEQATAAWCKFLRVPYRYAMSVDPDFRASILRYELQDAPDAEATLETLNGSVQAVHSPDVSMVTPTQVASIVSKVFDPDDTVRRVLLGDSRFHVDVTSELFQANFGPLPDKPEVGDITEAGLRFLSFPFQSKPPTVTLYAERLVCTNGMCSPANLGQIALKGKTVDEVIAEMEVAAQLLLDRAPQKLAELEHTRHTPVPGSPQAFVAQIAKEANVSTRVLHEVLDQVNQLPDPVTVWDIQNIFTDVANQVTSYSTLVKLQSIGGALAFDAPRQIERCTTCERKL